VGDERGTIVWFVGIVMMLILVVVIVLPIGYAAVVRARAATAADAAALAAGVEIKRQLIETTGSSPVLGPCGVVSILPPCVYDRDLVEARAQALACANGSEIASYDFDRNPLTEVYDVRVGVVSRDPLLRQVAGRLLGEAGEALVAPDPFCDRAVLSAGVGAVASRSLTTYYSVPPLHVRLVEPDD